MLTAEELLQLHVPNRRAELVRGAVVVREPAGFVHGAVAARLLLAIGNHVDPARVTARVYRADGSESILGAADELDGEDVLPGFACSVGSLVRHA